LAVKKSRQIKKLERILIANVFQLLRQFALERPESNAFRILLIERALFPKTASRWRGTCPKRTRGDQGAKGAGPVTGVIN
jgi:hypothetical protein